ncbi:MAG: hypothetical protein H6817_10700 [Phycisphaerales bacterium]|nr:hypothetical protein [Phycisphaerales bacterium]
MPATRWMRILCTGLVLSATVLAGCNTTEQEKAPDIPPESTMVMDFSDFGNEGITVSNARVVQSVPGTNWAGSVITIGIWSAIVTVTLVVPVAAFLESFNHEPTELENGDWQWAYEYRVSGVLHSAALQADVKLSGVEWNMYISKEGEYTDYHWFSGQSNLAVTEGTWTLNYPPGVNADDPAPFIFIEWTRDPNTMTGDIKYTNITDGMSDSNGFIYSAITEDEPFDAYYTIYTDTNANTTGIEWNLTTKDGRVRDAQRFGDSDWHCWDEDLQNVECP